MDGLEHHHAPLRRRRRRRFPCYLVGALVVAVVVKPVEHLRRGHKFPSADRIENELLRNSESLLVGLDPRRRRPAAALSWQLPSCCSCSSGGSETS